MISGLHLSGVRLVLYAIIYGYTQDPESGMFYGPGEMLAQWCNCSKDRVYKILGELVKEEFLIKEEKQIRGSGNQISFKKCTYRVNPDKIPTLF